MKYQDLFSFEKLNKKKKIKMLSAAVVTGTLRVNPFMSSRLFYHNSLDQSISISMLSVFFFFFLSSIFYRNSCS